MLVFVRPPAAQAALSALERSGLRTELVFPHWLGKGFDPKDDTTFVDVIYGSGNGLCGVDDEWFMKPQDVARWTYAIHNIR